MSSKQVDGPRPPSVDAVLRRLRSSVDGASPGAMTDVVRGVVAEERTRLRAGGTPRDAGLTDTSRNRIHSGAA